MFAHGKKPEIRPSRSISWCGLLTMEDRLLLSSDGSPPLPLAASVDLAVTQVTTSLQDVVVPGDRAHVRATISNVGAMAIRGTLPVVVETIDGQGGSTVIAAMDARISLTSGRATTVSIPITVSAQWLAGNMTINVRVDGSAVTDENSANDEMQDAREYDVRFEFGNVAGRRGQSSLVYQQDGRSVSLSLKGDGLGVASLDENGLLSLDFTGTTKRSAFRLSTRGDGDAPALADVFIDGDLKSFDAKPSYFQGDFHISGQLGSLTLGDVGNAQIHVGGAGFSNERLTLAMGQVEDLSLESAMALRSLKAVHWMDDNDDDQIIAPSIAKMIIAGDFEASMRLSDTTIKQSLGSLSVQGTARELVLQSAGSIGTIRTARLVDAVILSGIDGDAPPDNADDFARMTTIDLLEVTGVRSDPLGAAVIDSFVAASRIKSLKLTRIDTSAGAELHGIAADAIDRLSGTLAPGAVRFALSRLDEQAEFDEAGAQAGVNWGGFEITLLELPQFDPPVEMSVAATSQTPPVPSSGDAADDIAVWVDPTDPTRSFIVGTSKVDSDNGGLFIYDLAGQLIGTVASGQAMNNIDLRYGMAHDGAEVDVVAVTNRSRQSVDLFIVDAQARTLLEVGSISLDIPQLEDFGEAYGLAMHHDKGTGRYFVFASDKAGRIAQFELFSQGQQIVGQRVRYWKESGVVEGMVVDDDTGVLYIGQETKGIIRYDALPMILSSNDAASPPPADRLLVDNMDGPLAADVEGLALYRTSDGPTYLIASSQGSNEYVIYDAQSHRRLAVMRIVPTPDGSIGGTSDTDGIEAIAGNFGPAFPLGLFIAQDGSNPGGQNFKVVSWADIIDTAALQQVVLEGDGQFDPRD